MSTSYIKRRIGRFHVVFVQWTSNKCTKKLDARAELLFAHKPIFFFCVVVVVVIVVIGDMHAVVKTHYCHHLNRVNVYDCDCQGNR